MAGGTPIATAAALVLVAGVAACGGGEESSAPASTAVPTTTSTQARAPSQPKPSRPSRNGGKPEKGTREESNRTAVRKGVAQTKPTRLDPSQRKVAAVVRRYVDALDSRNGGAVCSLFVPGALDGVRLPRDRGGCGPSLTASIGYRDPRGFPVYAGSRVARMASVTIDGSTARAVATTVTQFAGDREPSIEDDVVYLEQRGGRWRIAKPSAALYRAIGVGNIPPSVLAPPS